NLSNAASLLWHCLHALPSPSNHTNWTGFYVLDPSSPPTTQLILGPFQGKVACQTIRFGRGVCGVAAQTKTTQVVGDVEMFPGHIACDAESKSEIVVPVIQNGEVSFCLPLLFFFFSSFEPFGRLHAEESSPSSMSIVPSKTPLTMKTKKLWKNWPN
ncbi:hypothetical protein D6D29_10768, partial [Aureobasidium pullulans]